MRINRRITMDKLIRAVDQNGSIRIFGAITTELTEKARKIHGLTPVSAAAFGRCMAANLMMAMDLKTEEETVSLQFKGDGPLGLIVTVAGSNGCVRGYVGDNTVDIPLKENGKLDVGGAVGQGYLTVIRDMKMKSPQVGRTELVSGEIAEDLANYFAVSEQIPSVVALGVLIGRDYSVKAAGGYIIQLMPGASEEEISKLEENIRKIDTVTNLITAGYDIEDIIKKACDGFGIEITAQSVPQYKCNCSEERIEKALISLGKGELEDILHNEGSTSLTCYFCNKKYDFPKEKLEKLIEDISK